MHKLISAAKEHFGDRDVATSELVSWGKTHQGQAWCSEYTLYKAGRGFFNFAQTAAAAPVKATRKSAAAPKTVTRYDTTESSTEEKVFKSGGTEKVINAGKNFDIELLTPSVDPKFVPYGAYTKMHKIIKSNRFFPIYIYGPTGVGKSTAAIQASASLGKQVMRITMTNETSDDDLFGSKTLENGSVVIEDGPVTIAAELGIPLIVDEISAGDPRKLIGFYNILEGKQHFIRGANKFVTVNPGFTIIATDNTLGRGDDSGEYVGLNILSEAFLDRFAIAIEHSYPPESVEQKMLRLAFNSVGELEFPDEKIADIVKWVNVIRKTYLEGASDSAISPRRVLFIPEHYSIFGNLKAAVEDICTRFGPVNAESFLDIYKKVVDNRDYGSTSDNDEVPILKEETELV